MKTSLDHIFQPRKHSALIQFWIDSLSDDRSLDIQQL